MDQASIAVVIPAHNAAGTLAAALDSVLAQSWPAIEIIVVDDGSTDRTASVLEDYAGRVRSLRLSNGGPSRARNAGMRATTGDFIAFLDADDVWLPGKLAAQMPEFADPEVGLVFCDFSLRYSSGDFLPSYMAKRPLAGDGWILERYLQSRFLFPSTIVARSEALERAGLFDESLRGAEDLELFARVAARWKVAFRREVLVSRWEGVQNLSADRSMMISSMVEAFRKIEEREPRLSRRERAILRDQTGQHLWWSGCFALERGDHQQARRELWQSLRTTPRQSAGRAMLLAASLLRRQLRGPAKPRG